MRITLRRRTTKAGTVTLYLDFYDGGRRWLEYLHLYLTGESKKDRQTLDLAETIRARRLLDAASDEHGLPRPSGKDADFIGYCQRFAEGRHKQNTRLVYLRAIAHLVKHAGASIPMARINAGFLMGFRDYLLDQVSGNSAGTYLGKIKTACRRAANERLLPRYPGDGVTIRKSDTHREFLTIEELRKLNRTRCGNEAVKAAFLFSAFSGLRWGDLRTLEWGQVRREGRETYLQFTQEKTGAIERMVLSAEAAAILRGQEGKLPAPGIKIMIPDNVVFPLPAQQTADKTLRKWIRAAGIEKRISFHNARHTFATLALKYGADLYVVSKLLGHRRIETTQIYAKVIDESKRAAVRMLPRLGGNSHGKER